ncbi:hypothetical protein VN12_19630 [Pirellula sp. SH-Sr6A]|nr:hypothetical protein VN12_02180 [Pirellula sp. SH-Sr6A]AMV31314.1 hypothetical protein VN12_04300 [Pirellula sp. SH-Sr6A]AMV34346.1 hypothetical protein VN12_19630 [Pirellula sp. SH-Sr6A]
MSGVKIKPLAWVKGNPNISEWTAETPLGKFRVIKRYQDKSAIVYMAPFDCGVCPDFLDIEDAKAWCQAEYERRVRECLE